MAESGNTIDKMLQTKTAAHYLGMPLRSFQRLMAKNNKKKPPHYRIGHKYFFKPKDLDAWLEAQKSG